MPIIPDEDYSRLYAATVAHDKPLVNAMGENYNDVLTLDKVADIFLVCDKCSTNLF